ncbi:Lrp/AsnC family transcriptional regulator [Pasteurella skyensis]|uniref:Lrp/AsnC family transcriptional regulator n=1 Tax=Phocoenobacter skyensis TaxID=97481 RepID=A0AAJ6NEV1_9PAST|nr:Lrp/AsnC family transcriptional regulator [Pasteurella skyensis]MDP8171275.1 Lrp/AsnC family transcriptional regulator [Pasteurella skyensis]MDP8175508.1 Lrp/AsnC family transcriptional regulator [Pasteurella skyensis]
MDNYDIKILRLLHDNARITVKEISQKIHLSQPTCAERVKKLESNGIIQNYTTVIDWQSLGYNLSAIVRIRPLPSYLQRVEALIQGMNNISWCYKVTGDDAFICQLLIKSVTELDDCLSPISQIAMTNTSIIKSAIVSNQFLDIETSFS